VCEPVAALHQGAPGQMTWLEDPPPWLLLCFASVISDRQLLCFILTVKQSQQRWRPLCFEGDNFFEEKSASG